MIEVLELILRFLENHWAQIISILGGSTGSGFVVKKIIDRHRAKVISNLIKDVEILKKENTTIRIDMTELKKDIERNTAFDKQLKADLDTRFTSIDNTLKSIDKTQKYFFDKMIDIYEKLGGKEKYDSNK